MDGHLQFAVALVALALLMIVVTLVEDDPYDIPVAKIGAVLVLANMPDDIFRWLVEWVCKLVN